MPSAQFAIDELVLRKKPTKKRLKKVRSERTIPISERAVSTAAVAFSGRQSSIVNTPAASSSRVTMPVHQIPRTLNTIIAGNGMFNYTALIRNYPEFSRIAGPCLRDYYAKEKNSQKMIDGVTGCEIEVPPFATNALFPGWLQITIHVTTSPQSIPPTHILISPKNRPGRAPGFFLYPIHSIPFVLNCLNFPDFIPSDSDRAACKGTLGVPVIDFTLPSPETFECLRTYLYNKDLAELQDKLVPPRSQWATNMVTIELRVAFIRGFWQNACALGVEDQEMYILIDRCWDIVYNDRCRLAGGHLQ